MSLVWPNRSSPMAKYSVIIFLGAVALGIVAEVFVVLQSRYALGQVRKPTVNLFGEAAAQRGWPANPPEPWPSVYQFSERSAFGASRQTAWATDIRRETTHQMEVERYGWPQPVLVRTQLWWPLQDARWGTPKPAGMGWRVRWKGSLFDVTLFTTIAVGLIAVPTALVRSLRRRKRARSGRCLECGYQLATGPVCPECGCRSSYTTTWQLRDC